MTLATEGVSVAEFIEAQKVRIESMMQRRFEKRPPWPPRLEEAVRYSLFAGGKRLRPVLALTVVELLGRDFTKFENLFIALECIHTYSLIHDDLPSMDDDELRRGQPTSHKKFGEAVAILAGDALLTYAFEIISEETFMKNFQEANVVRCLNHIAAASGAGGMVGGQFIDVNGGDKPDTEERLREMHSLKTAKLLAASVTAPAILAGSHGLIQQKLTDYGNSIGLAFQILDDILNVVGNEQEMGKSPGSDQQKGKWTYPRVVGVPVAMERARELCSKAKYALDAFPQDKRKPLELLADFIIERMK